MRAITIAFAIFTVMLVSQAADAAKNGFRVSDPEFADYQAIMELISADFGGKDACEMQSRGDEEGAVQMIYCKYPAGYNICINVKGEKCFDTGETPVDFGLTKIKFKKKNTKAKVQGQSWFYLRCEDKADYTVVLKYSLSKKDGVWSVDDRSQGMSLDVGRWCTKALEEAEAN